MGSSVHDGYYWSGTVAFCIAYWKHAKFSPSSWKTVCGYTTGLFIVLLNPNVDISSSRFVLGQTLFYFDYQYLNCAISIGNTRLTLLDSL
jgi:hypothetical protein